MGKYQNTQENFNKMLDLLDWKIYYDNDNFYVHQGNSFTKLNDTHISDIISNFAKYDIVMDKNKILLNLKGSYIKKKRYNPPVKYSSIEKEIIEFIEREYISFENIINRKIYTKDLYHYFITQTKLNINTAEFGKLIKKLYGVNTKVIRINHEVFRIYEQGGHHDE
jgi:hypothetical protein